MVFRDCRRFAGAGFSAGAEGASVVIRVGFNRSVGCIHWVVEHRRGFIQSTEYLLILVKPELHRSLKKQQQ